MIEGTLFILLTKNCNLHCPHCDLSDTAADGFDKEKVIEQVKAFNGYKVLFGGEPTLYKERLLAVAPYAEGITTNLINMDDEIFNAISKLNVATSYTPHRFTEETFNIWWNNVQKFNRNISVIITLSPDMIAMPLDNAKDLLLKFSTAFDTIEFEHIVDHSLTQSYYDKANDWLYEIFLWWRENIKDVKCNMFDYSSFIFKECNYHYTLFPNGELKKYCPHLEPRFLNQKCYSCEWADVCQPCSVQKYCVYPKKIKEFLRNNT